MTDLMSKGRFLTRSRYRVEICVDRHFPAYITESVGISSGSHYIGSSIVGSDNRGSTGSRSDPLHVHLAAGSVPGSDGRIQGANPGGRHGSIGKYLDGVYFSSGCHVVVFSLGSGVGSTGSTVGSETNFSIFQGNGSIAIDDEFFFVFVVS